MVIRVSVLGDFMTLAADTKAILDAMNAFEIPDFTQLPAAEARALMGEMRGPATELPPLKRREDVLVPSSDGAHQIPCRIYEGAGDEAKPILVYFHGGGWVFGGLDGHDLFCAELSLATGTVILSVDYRLAPEAKFPIPLQD